jgi:hypothetical protein
MIDQEKIVDDIMLDELELKVPGCKEHINNTDSKKKRLGMLSVLGSNYNRDYFEGYRSLIVKEKVCAEYITDIVYTLRNYIGVADTEIKTHGEVMTPLNLVDKMLDRLPKHVWKNKHLKWLDPANGVGTFPSAIVKRLMEGLKEEIPDSCERYQHIVENMIYVVEIQSKNMFLYHCAFDIDNTHKLKTFYGSFLSKEFDEHMKNVWGIDKFDIIVGNPPYQEQKPGFKKTQPIWDKFVDKSISILNDGGYLIIVHPSGWRNVGGNYKHIQNLLKERDLLFLEMNGTKTGFETFGVNIEFDYYILQNTFCDDNFKTEIIDYNKNELNISLRYVPFIPNADLELVYSLMAKEGEEKVNVLHSFSAYETRKLHMSKNKDDEFKYPCAYTIGSKNPNFWYSNKKTIHFGESKVIWGNGLTDVIIDENGEYGLTQFTYAIVDDKDNLPKIQKALKSQKFIQNVMGYNKGVGHIYNRKVISTFRKDFWKEFI